MFLAVDIGNTNISCGIFDDNNLIKTFEVPTDFNMTTECFKVLENYNIEECIICSVVPELNNVITNVLKSYKIKSSFLTSSTNMNIKVNVPNPNEVGADRLANACAAFELYKTSYIVVDAGSAITFDIVDKNSAFIGGIIMPGLNMQLKALNTNTSKLPEIEIEKVNKVIGNNTRSAILSGVIKGTAAALDGLIKQCKNELGEQTKIIGTGGNAEFLQGYMSVNFDEINPNLTLEGLYSVWKKQIK